MPHFNAAAKPCSLPSPPAADARRRRLSPRASRRLGVFAVAVAAGMAAACAGKIPATHYYVLELPAPPMRTAAPLPHSALVMPFGSSRMLSRDSIVYRPSSGEVGFYEYHRWAEHPRETVTTAFIEHLRASRTFQSIALFDGRTTADYRIQGRIERLEEVDFQGGVSVSVKLSAELVEIASRKTVWQGSAEESGQVSVGEVREVVGEMARAAGAGVQKLAGDLDRFLRSAEAQRAAASTRPPQAERN